jgi:mRNA interferase RelE/StbE
MLALRLPPEIEQRLDALAKKTGRSKSYYAREAILRQIEDIEDTYLARRRQKRGGSRVTLESLERDRRVLSYLRTRIAGSGDPRRFGQPLTGDLQGFWRYRVGDYRIVAEIEDNRFVVLVVTVGHRREVYR